MRRIHEGVAHDSVVIGHVSEGWIRGRLWELVVVWGRNEEGFADVPWEFDGGERDEFLD